MLNPVFKNKITTIIYFSIWLLLSLFVWILLHYFYDIESNISLNDSLISNLSFSAFGIGIWYVVKFNDSADTSFLKIILNHSLSAIIISSFGVLISYYFIKQFYAEIGISDFYTESIIWRFIFGIFIYSVLALVFYVVLYNENLKQKIREEADLKAIITQTELKALKNQINPHFLFNSLNSISSLTINNPEKAREMLVKLSDLMRYSLKTKSNEKSLFKVELGNIEKYLAIEKVRFGDKLKYTTEIQNTCLEKYIPNLILQPLFENAIKYGLYGSTDCIEIKLYCKSIDDELNISIENDFDQYQNIKKGEGIGLSNISKRLANIYKRQNLIFTKIENEKFIVSLIIPQD